MMKKTALAMAVMFALSNFGFAGEGKFGKGHKEMDPEQKAKWEAAKKEKTEYFANVQALIEKYNKADEADKAAVKEELTALVAAQTDKNLEAQKEKLARMQAKISETEADKTAFINKKVDFMLSPEWQDKMKQMKEKKGKKGKKDKKHSKKNKNEKKSK